MSELPTKEERKAFQRAPIWPFPHSLLAHTKMFMNKKLWHPFVAFLLSGRMYGWLSKFNMNNGQELKHHRWLLCVSKSAWNPA